MTTTANRGKGALSRFANFAGLGKARADEDAATVEDVTKVEDKLDDTQDDVNEVEDRLDDVEDRLDDVEDDVDEDDEDGDKVVDPDEPPADKPEMRAAYRKGKANGRKAGAKSERARAGAILETKAAASNPVLAMHLAFETNSTPKAALATLKAAHAGAPRPAATAKQAKVGLDDRMTGTRKIDVGGGGQASGPDMNTADGVAAHCLAVARRAGVVK